MLLHIPLFFHWQSMQLYHLTSTEVSMITLFLLSMRRGFKVLAQMMVMEKICDGHELHFRQILQNLETICVLPLVGNNNLMAYSNPAKCAKGKSRYKTDFPIFITFVLIR